MKNIVLGASIAGTAIVAMLIGMSFMTKGFDEIGIGPYSRK